MKKNKNHIIVAWMLMLCFLAGQFVVYAHQHAANEGFVKSTYQHPTSQPGQTISQYCRLCDAMHHSSMSISSQAFFAPVVVNNYHFKPVQYDFVGIALILSAGRAPPVA